MTKFDRRRALGLGLGATAGFALISPALAAKGGLPGKPNSGGSGGTTSTGSTGTSSGSTGTGSTGTGSTGTGSTGTGSTGTSSGSTSTSALQAVITLNGQTYTVAASQGQDLGNFVSDIGGFTQQCIRVAVPGLPMTVFFRPDLGTGRVEVVFELGRCFNATPVNLGAYSVAISDGSQLLANINVPAHYWFSRWRWQSAPRPIVGNIDTLISQNLLPPYNRSTTPPSGTTVQTYAIMGLAGVEAYMPTTGERLDIGMVTEPQGQYICSSDQNALATLRAQAEAAGTVPWHMRDENTGAPISFQTYPMAAWFADQPGTGTPYVPTISTPITIDDAHQPALAYVPYLLTGDPYHLEDLQFQATWNYGSLPTGYRPHLSQTRQFAWSMRTLGQCARITPATVPSWLQGQSYWATLMTAHRVFFEDTYVNNPSLVQSLFRATDNIDNRPTDGNMPAGTWCEPWESEFLAAIFGWLVSMGLTEWRTSFDWVIGGTVARTNGASGWPRAQSTPYEQMLRASATSPIAQSWSEAWSLNHTIGGLTYSDPNTWVAADMTYLTYTRGALVYATKLGTVLTDNLSWATGQLTAKNWNTAYKWRIGTGI